MICLTEFGKNSSVNLSFLTNDVAIILGVISIIEWAILIWYVTRPQPEWLERWFPA